MSYSDNKFVLIRPEIHLSIEIKSWKAHWQDTVKVNKQVKVGVDLFWSYVISYNQPKSYSMNNIIHISLFLRLKESKNSINAP